VALVIADNVVESSTSTGTGNFALAGAYTGYRAFDDLMANGDTTYYQIEALDVNGNRSGDWEIGLGTFNDTDTLVRTAVHASTNSNNAVNFAAGTKRVSMNASARYLSSPRAWTPNFSANGEIRFYADVAMTVTEIATSGTGTIAYEKSTSGAPSTFNSTSSPITLEAGAWLKVSASSVTGLVAVHLRRTA
jgi:hypothetical protein